MRYLPEAAMQEHVRTAAVAQGFDDAQALMLSSCARNIYSIGCEYHPSTITILEEICRAPSAAGEAWAVLLTRCLDGAMPRLRSSETAAARIAAARAAAARKRQQQKRQP